MERAGRERLHRHVRKFGGGMHAFIILTVVMVLWVCMDVRTSNYMFYVHFIVRPTYLNNAVKTYSHKMISRGLPTQFCFLYDFSFDPFTELPLKKCH